MTSFSVQIIPVTAFAQNCSIVMCNHTRKAAVIDPGGEVERIQQALSEMNAIPEKILLTHAHIDHAGGTAQLAEALSLPIEGPHKDDQFWIDMLPQQAAMFQFPQAPAFEPDRWLNDGDVVSVGEQLFEVLHTPGHTPGHVVFFHRGEQKAWVGDVIFNGSIGRTDFPQGDHDTLVRSIRNQLFPLGDEVEFICGHGPNSTFGHERQHNPFVADHRG